MLFSQYHNQICTGIQETSEKYLIETKYVSPFMMVAFEGIVGFICTSGEELENGKYDENSLLHCNPYSNTNHVIDYFFGSIYFIATHQRYIFLLFALFISFFFSLIYSEYKQMHNAVPLIEALLIY